MELKYVNMDDIEKALKENDFCEAMERIDFELFGFDEDDSDNYFFMRKDSSLIVHYLIKEAKFWTYPRANNKEVLV